MQIIGLNIGGALSRLASQQEASQENWFNLLKSTQDLAKYWYKGCLCVYFTFPMSRILEQDRRYKIIFGML